MDRDLSLPQHGPTVNYSYAIVKERSKVMLGLSEKIVEKLYSSLEKKEWPQADYGLAFIRFVKRLSESLDSPRIVLLLDEMDALSQQSLGSLANTIRGIFHQKMEEHELQKFVFIYAAGANILTLAEGRGSPLRNITDSLYLGDLSRSEAMQVLEHGFAPPEGIQIEEVVADHIYGWTHGHPYLTQALGNVLVEMKQQQGGDFHLDQTSVDKAVQLLQTKGDPNLQHVVNALKRASSDSPALLEKVRDMLESRDKIHFSRTDPEILQLELMGIVREGEDGYCTIRNQIYQQILQYAREGEAKAATEEHPTPESIQPQRGPAESEETIRHELFETKQREKTVWRTWSVVFLILVLSAGIGTGIGLLLRIAFLVQLSLVLWAALVPVLIIGATLRK